MNISQQIEASERMNIDEINRYEMPVSYKKLSELLEMDFEEEVMQCKIQIAELEKENQKLKDAFKEIEEKIKNVCNI